MKWKNLLVKENKKLELKYRKYIAIQVIIILAILALVFLLIAI